MLALNVRLLFDLLEKQQFKEASNAFFTMPPKITKMKPLVQMQ